MSPTQRRRRERTTAWLRSVAMLLLTLAGLAVAQITLILTTMPVTLPEPVTKASR